MKKLSKILALSLALALTFSMTVFADESPDPDGLEWAQEAKPSATDSEGNPVTVTVAAPSKTEVSTVKEDIAKSDSALTTEVKKAAQFSKIKTPELIFVLDITPTEEINGAITVTIEFAGLKAAAAGEVYVLMHQNGDSWEPVSGATVTADKVTFTSSSFSNYALFLVKQDNTTTQPQPQPQPQQTQQPAQPTAPQTGETVPVAGFVALILLAGAAVCAKKAQFNN